MTKAKGTHEGKIVQEIEELSIHDASLLTSIVLKNMGEAKESAEHDLAIVFNPTVVIHKRGKMSIEIDARYVNQVKNG